MSIPCKKLKSFLFSFPFLQFVRQMLSVSLVFQTNQKESQNHIKYTLRKVKCFHPDQVITKSAHIHNSGITEVTTHKKISRFASNLWIERSTQHVHVHMYCLFVCLFVFFKIYFYYYYCYYSKSGLARAWLEPFPPLHHLPPLLLLKETNKDQTEITF